MGEILEQLRKSQQDMDSGSFSSVIKPSQEDGNPFSVAPQNASAMNSQDEAIEFLVSQGYRTSDFFEPHEIASMQKDAPYLPYGLDSFFSGGSEKPNTQSNALSDNGEQYSEKEREILKLYQSNTGNAFLDKFSAVEGRNLINLRRQQRAFADQYPSELTDPIADLISNRNYRGYQLQQIRKMTPEQREQALMLAPGISQKLAEDQSKNYGYLALAALQQGAVKGVYEPATELVNLGGSPEEVDFIKKLDALSQGELALYSENDPWYIRDSLQAIEMAPFQALTLLAARGGGSLTSRVSSQVSSRAAAGSPIAQRTMEAGKRIANLPKSVGLPAMTAKEVGQAIGVTGAGFVTMYSGEVEQLKANGMEDGAKLRALAAVTALVMGRIEALKVNPFSVKPGTVSLKDGALRAARQYIAEAAKNMPAELTEEWLQGVVSGAGEYVSQYLQSDVEVDFGDGNVVKVNPVEKKSLLDALQKGQDQANQAIGPLAFSLGLPASVGATSAAYRAGRISRGADSSSDPFIPQLPPGADTSGEISNKQAQIALLEAAKSKGVSRTVAIQQGLIKQLKNGEWEKIPQWKRNELAQKKIDSLEKEIALMRGTPADEAVPPDADAVPPVAAEAPPVATPPASDAFEDSPVPRTPPQQPLADPSNEESLVNDQELARQAAMEMERARSAEAQPTAVPPVAQQPSLLEALLSEPDDNKRQADIRRLGLRKHNIATRTLNDGDRIYDPWSNKTGVVTLGTAPNGMSIMRLALDDGTTQSYSNMNWLLKESDLTQTSPPPVAQQQSPVDLSAQQPSVAQPDAVPSSTDPFPPADQQAPPSAPPPSTNPFDVPLRQAPQVSQVQQPQVDIATSEFGVQPTPGDQTNPFEVNAVTPLPAKKISYRKQQAPPPVVQSTPSQSPRGEDFFAPEAIEAARKDASDYKSRTNVISMSPDDFLQMAEQLGSEGAAEVSTEKSKTVAGVLDRGDKFSSIPHLSFEIDPKTGDAKVVGHEGRHRAMALRALGVKSMPVTIRGPIRWDQQSDPKNFDRVKSWPANLLGETETTGADGKKSRPSIPFPVQDPLQSTPADAVSVGDQREEVTNVQGTKKGGGPNVKVQTEGGQSPFEGQVIPQGEQAADQTPSPASSQVSAQQPSDVQPPVAQQPSAPPSARPVAQYVEIKQNAAGVKKTIRGDRGGRILLIEQSKGDGFWSIRDLANENKKGKKPEFIVSGVSGLKQAKNIADRIFDGTYDSEDDKRFDLQDTKSLAYSNDKLPSLWNVASKGNLASTLSATGYYTDGRILVKVSDKDRDAILKKAGKTDPGRIVNIESVVASAKEQTKYSDNEMTAVGYRGGDVTSRVVMLKNKAGQYAMLDKAYHDTVMKRHPNAKIWGGTSKGNTVESAILYEVDGDAVGLIMPMSGGKVDKYLSAMIEGRYEEATRSTPKAAEPSKAEPKPTAKPSESQAPPTPVAEQATPSPAESAQKEEPKAPSKKKKPKSEAKQEEESPAKTYLRGLSDQDLRDLAKALKVAATEREGIVDAILAKVDSQPAIKDYLEKAAAKAKPPQNKKRPAASRTASDEDESLSERPEGKEIASKDFTEDERNQEQILKKIGVTLRLVEGDPNQRNPGLFIPETRTIWLVRNYVEKWNDDWKREGRPEKAMTWGLFSHEMFHAIKRKSPKAWKALYNWVSKNDPVGLGKAKVAYYADTVGENEEYAKRLREDEDLLNDEGLSRYIEDRAAYFKFWNELGKAEPGLLGKIGRWIRRVLRFAEPGATNPETLAGQTRLAIERAMKRHKVSMKGKGGRRAAASKTRKADSERKSRTLDEVRSRVAKDYRLTVASNPMQMVNGKPFSSLDPDVAGKGLLIQDADAAMQRMMSESLKEAGVPEDIASTVQVPSSKDVDYAFRLTNGSRYWYELSAIGFVKDFFNLSRKLTERLIDIVAGTSGGQKPTDNLKVAVASMAQDMQGLPVSVGTRDESSLTAALSPSKLETHKFGNFSDTMQVLGGLRPGVKPLPTIDLQMAAVFGVQHAAIASDPRMYEAMSRFLIKLRDAQNAMLKEGEQPYESWQIQALLWVAQRDTSDPDSFNIGMPKIVDLLKKAGIPTPGGKITKETLMDPRTPAVLAPTSKIIPEAYTVTLKTRTKLTKVGRESAEIFDELKTIDAPWARNLVEEFEKIQRRTMRAIGDRRPPKPGNKTRQKSIASWLLSVIMDKSPNSHELSRVDTKAWGTYKGEASPNIRFPLNLGKVGDTEEGGGTKRYVPTKKHREQFLAILGKYLKQEGQAASEFIPAEFGSHDTFSILVRRYDKVGITESELAEISDGFGRPISYKQVPNGWQLDINIGGEFNETDEQKAENRDLQRIQAVMQKFASKGAIGYKILPRSYDSDYIEASDYNKHIRRLENEILRNSDARGSGKGVEYTPERRASDYAFAIEQIKAIAAKQESAFRKWTKDARELAAKREIQFGDQRRASPGRRASVGRGDRDLPEDAGQDRPVSDRGGSSKPPSYGKPREGSVSYVGRHYSRQPREFLSVQFRGTGIRGAEERRLQYADDNRIKQRIYFYIDTAGEIKPERGVGSFAHEVELNNLYDPESGLIPRSGGANDFETAVIDAGFDGYIAKPYGMAVLLGPQHTNVPVRLMEENNPDEGVRYSPRRQGKKERDPEVTKAAQDLKAGLIDQDQYQRIVDLRMPLRKFDEVPTPASKEDMIRGLGNRKAGERLKRDLIRDPESIDEGRIVEARLDIPAYESEDVWVVALHQPRSNIKKGTAAKVVAFTPTAVLKNVTFGVTADAALNIAAGKAKATIATMRGKYVPMTAKQAYNLAQTNKGRWVEIGMNPIRHTFFYDKDTQTPVESAEEVVQVGGMVLAKNPKPGKREDYRYAVRRQLPKPPAAIADALSQKTDDEVMSEYKQKWKAAPSRGPFLRVMRNQIPSQQDSVAVWEDDRAARLFLDAIDSSPLVENVLYRGTNVKEIDRFIEDPEAQELPRGFSTDKRVAKKFSDGAVIVVEPGARGLRIGGTTENELIVRGPFDVVSDEMRSGTRVLRVRQSGNVRYSPRRQQQDSDYLAAVERGDMKTAQQMVDDAAKAAGVPTIGVNINDGEQPFTEQILSGEKTIETRDSENNALAGLVGQRIAIVKTGKAKAKVVGYATVGEPIRYTSKSQFDADYNKHLVSSGKYGFKGFKIGYPLLDVERIDAYEAPPATGVIKTRPIHSPIAQDEQGKVIPLSKRFDDQQADIRYSPRRQTETPAFKKWFGDSKVVDEEGRPLVVYRGTRRVPKPDRFSTTLGRATTSWTPDPEAASVYSRSLSSLKYEGGSVITSAFLSIRKPLDLRDLGESASLWDVIENLNYDLSEEYGENGKVGWADVSGALRDLDETTYKTNASFEIDAPSSDGIYRVTDFYQLADLIEELAGDGDAAGIENALSETSLDLYALADSKAFVELLKFAGYDGIIHKDVFEVGSMYYEGNKSSLEEGNDGSPIIDAYRPFNQTQIKSATGNIGTFDPNNPDIRYSPRRQQQDADYLAAVDRGDMKTAQSMVDDLAEQFGEYMGGVSPVVYHGSPHADFYEFQIPSRGFNSTVFGSYEVSRNAAFFTPDKKVASDYQTQGGRKSGSTRRFRVFGELLDLRDGIRDSTFNALTEKGVNAKWLGRKGASWELFDREEDPDGTFVKALKEMGYDGVIIKDTDGTSDFDSYVAFSPSQIKSSDPVTYDDAGNVIPLSQRFDDQQADIRYSPRRQKRDETLAGLYDLLAKEGLIDPQAVPQEGDERTTSIKNRKTDELRAKFGFPPRVRPARERFQDWEDQARREYPTAKDRLRLIEEAERNPERLGTTESAAIGQHINDLNNRADAGENVNDEMLLTVRVSNLIGTEGGRFLVSRKAERYSDFSLAGLIDQHLASVGSDPTETQMQEYAELAKRYKKLEEDNKKLVEKLAKETIARKKAEAASQPEPQPPKRGTKRATVSQKFADTLSVFRNLLRGGGNRPAAGRNPRPQTDIRYSPSRQPDDIATAAKNVVSAARKAGVSSMLELEAQIKTNLTDLTSEEIQIIRDAWNESVAENKIESPIGDDPTDPELGARAKELMRAAIELGYGAKKEDWMDVVDVVYEQLSTEVPGISKYETMQAMSDYGVWQSLNSEPVEVIIRAVRGKARQSLKIEDTIKAIKQSEEWLAEGVSPEEVARRLREKNLLPLATGQERATPDSIERELISQFNKLKKTLPVSAESKEGQLKSALTTAKTAAKNRLELLDKDIAALQEAVTNKTKLVKPVDEKTPLEPDKDLLEVRSQLEQKRRIRDKLKADYEKLFPSTKPKKGRKPLTEEQRLDASVRMLERQINAVKADVKALEDGTWAPAAKNPELTSQRKEELLDELRSLRQLRKDALAANPVYQATEELKYWERYRKAQERRLAFWQRRLEEAKAGRIPAPLKKRTITEKAILEKNMEIEEVQYEAMVAIEKAKRATWNTGQWIGKGLLEATSLIPKTLMLGMEMSFVLRQGFFYTYSQPMKAFYALVESIPAVFSQRLALEAEDGLKSRPNAKEYELAKVDFTKATGPQAKLEELYQSAIIRWLENTETKLLLPLRTWAKLYAMAERGNRTFSNIMKADMYDIQKRDTLAAREFFGVNTGWTEADIKETGRIANIFSGRGTGLKGGNPWLDWLFLARRWTWSRIQADFIVPFQLVTPQWIGQWNADRGMRVALAKLYIQAMVGHTAKMAAAYVAYRLLAGDDEEEMPTIEFDLRSSDALAMKIGETRFKDEGGLMPAVVLASRILTGKMKTSEGEIKSIYGDDVQYGGKTAADFIINYGRYKLGTAPSAILEWASGRDAVGNVIADKDDPTAIFRNIVGTRISPLTYREIYAAESELGLKRGALAALEAFFGVSVSTHGSRSNYKQASEEDRKKQFEKDIEAMEYNTPDFGYKDLLTEKQVKQMFDERESKKQAVVYAALANPQRKTHKSDESFAKSIAERDKAIDKFREMGLDFNEARLMLLDYYKRQYGSAYEMRGKNYVLRESYVQRLRQLRRVLERK